MLQPRPGQPPVDFGALNINVSPPHPPMPALPGRDREAQLLRRIRELEEESRSLRVENEKQVGSRCTLSNYVLQRLSVAFNRKQ